MPVSAPAFLLPIHGAPVESFVTAPCHPAQSLPVVRIPLFDPELDAIVVVVDSFHVRDASAAIADPDKATAAAPLQRVAFVFLVKSRYSDSKRVIK